MTPLDLTSDANRLMDAAEAAAYLHVEITWVYEHSTGRRRPQLPSFKLGKYRRYRKDEIDRWLTLQGEGRSAA